MHYIFHHSFCYRFYLYISSAEKILNNSLPITVIGFYFECLEQYHSTTSTTMIKVNVFSIKIQIAWEKIVVWLHIVTLVDLHKSITSLELPSNFIDLRVWMSSYCYNTNAILNSIKPYFLWTIDNFVLRNFRWFYSLHNKM